MNSLGQMQCDVVVVGGGPAGSTTARQCALKGLHTVLIDKAAFPRDKPCGGGVTPRAERLLGVDLTPVIERQIDSVRFTARPGTDICRRSPEVLTYLTQRRFLDSFLVEQAKEAGVIVCERTPFESSRDEGDRIRVMADSLSLSTRLIVGADGANGIVARDRGIRVQRWKGIALEGNVNISGQFPLRWESTMGVDFSHIRGGYGWIFPKRDHVNIGVGGWYGVGPSLRDRLADLTKSYGYDETDLRGLKGHPLPVRKPGSPITGDKTILVGDAAGLLDPFTGEGIYAAILSGTLAAQRVADFVRGDSTAIERYREDIERELAPDLRVSRKLADLYHLWPWFWTQGLRLPMVWSLAKKLLDGEQSYAGASAGSGALSSALSGIYDALKLISSPGSGATNDVSWRHPLFFGA
jgi:geranylgeranyl reductase family protein